MKLTNPKQQRNKMKVRRARKAVAMTTNQVPRSNPSSNFFDPSCSVFPKNSVSQTLRKPLPHQAEALIYAAGKKQIALYMEMRLGKTLVTIRWAKEHKGRKLVVAPVTALADWERELVSEGVPLTRIHWLTHNVKNKEETVNKYPQDWFLVNYQSTPKAPLIPDGWETIIVDECTALRNPKAKFTKYAIRTLNDIPNRAILSGLPAPEASMDYFSQFCFLHGSFLGQGNFWAFRKKHFHAGWSQWALIPNKGTLEMIKQEVHRLAFVRTRRQCKIGPKKVYQRRVIDMNPEQKKLYAQVEGKFDYKKNGEWITTKYSPVKFSWMSQIAGGFYPGKEEPSLRALSDTKFKELLYLLQGELQNEKVVVWFRFNVELYQAQLFLNSKGIKTKSVYGAVERKERAEASQEFKKDPKIQVMLAQVKCAKFSMDWSVASTAIYFSNSYAMEDRAQSEDRIIHPLNTGTALYIDLISRGTIDEDVVDILRDKNVNSRMFMRRLVERWEAKCKK